MTKLPKEYRFVDFSDYARPFAVFFTKKIIKTKITPVQITWLFTAVGFIAALLLITDSYVMLPAVLIVVKSFLDAVDGELARMRKKPSYTGRYLDSVNDFIVNVFLLLAIAQSVGGNYLLAFLSAVALSIQCSQYNYYYLLQRYLAQGDRTSRINEKEKPVPYHYENANYVFFLHRIYMLIYGWQDKLIYMLDKRALGLKKIPSWFLTLVSINGLGFQLLIISVMIICNYQEYVILFFLVPMNIYMILLFLIRRVFIK